MGHYGEGFKVAAVCLLRDHAVVPVCVSGNRGVALAIADTPVAGTDMRPLTYRFYEVEPGIAGTRLLLPRCKPKLATAIRNGMTHFFHTANPLLGKLVWGNPADFAIYESSTPEGRVFYRNLKRGEMENISLVLVLNKSYQAMERKTASDRDRNFFGGEIMKLFFNLFVRYGASGNLAASKIIVRAAESIWQKGHSLLAELAHSQRGGWPESATREMFRDRYYTAGWQQKDPAKQLEVERLLIIWRDEGRRELPQYFRSFGVHCPEDALSEVWKKAADEAKRLRLRLARRPSSAEQKSMSVLTRCLQCFAPAVTAVFNSGKLDYTVAQTETLLGELRSGRGYRSREVFIAAQLFLSEFSRPRRLPA